MKKWTLIHPFLFGLFFVLALYAANVAEVSPSQVVLPALVVLGGTALLMSLGWLLLRDATKSALATSVLVVLCFSFGHVVNLMPKAAGAGYNFFTPTSGWTYLLFLVWGGVAVASLYFIWRSRLDLRRLASVLNVVGVVLVVVPTVNIAVKEIGGSGSSPGSGGSIGIELTVPAVPPDVYYIILDRYSSESTLQEIYGFDNRDFLDYLEEKGFYVAGESCANYFHTQHSLASSLNMNYLDELAERVGSASTDEGPIYAMMEDYEIWRLLRSVGYQFIHLGSWWEPTRENRYADININYRGSLPEFSMLLLRTTLVDPVGTTIGLWGEPRRTQWERVRYKFERLAELPSIEGPKFVFAHFLTPHPDYVFDRDGSFIAPPTQAEVQRDGAEAVLRDRYIRQLEATNGMVKSLVDSLVANSSTPPIIILQSDEGPYPREPNAWSWDGGTPAERRQKVEILNAYYFPGIDISGLYDSITPANSFRAMFNLYFGCDLELLPDRIYMYEPARPYEFHDVTEVTAN